MTKYGLTPVCDCTLQDLLTQKNLARFLARLCRQSGDWQSWDETPWQHPWLTSTNLRSVKEYSRNFLEKEKRILNHVDPKKFEIGFCGNIANTMYVRAVPLRRAGLNIEIYLSPQDEYVMSRPGWEEFDGSISNPAKAIEELKKNGTQLPEIPGVHQYPMHTDWKTRYASSGLKFLRRSDIKNFSTYLPYIETLIALQEKDVLWATQVPYLAYLANRPNVVSQMGGDLWFEASRGDELGALMRRSFRCARLNLASNPWTFAHARRFNMSNVIYLPKIIDQNVYSPGHGQARRRWEVESGGNFFVLTSSRIDERNKGSMVGLEGFAEFSRSVPNARLVFIGWGKGLADLDRRLLDLGIMDKVIRLPVSGKAGIRDILRSADVSFDQFVLGYYGSAGMEAMACGLPVIARNESDQYDALCETGGPPILNASMPAEVAKHLSRLHADSQRRMEVADASRKWFVANHGSERWLPEITAVLAATALGRPANMRANPLTRPHSIQERIYHLKNWLAAPPYPNYGY